MFSPNQCAMIFTISINSPHTQPRVSEVQRKHLIVIFLCFLTAHTQTRNKYCWPFLPHVCRMQPLSTQGNASSLLKSFPSWLSQSSPCWSLYVVYLLCPLSLTYDLHDWCTVWSLHRWDHATLLRNFPGILMKLEKKSIKTQVQILTYRTLCGCPLGHKKDWI